MRAIGMIAEKRGRMVVYHMRSFEGLIPDQQNTLQGKLEASTDIEGLKKVLDCGKVIRSAICVAHGDRKIKNPMHHACLKNILEELIVGNGPPCFDLKYPFLPCGVGVGIEALLFLAFASKEHRDFNFVIGRLPFLDMKADRFQSRPKSLHNRIAGLVGRSIRIDGIGDF
jgi:hypothetical protein